MQLVLGKKEMPFHIARSCLSAALEYRSSNRDQGKNAILESSNESLGLA
jgi:hypothetical protein